MLAGRGPWIRGFGRQPVPSAPGWEASADVVAAVGDLLRNFDAHGLTTIARLHALAMTVRVEQAENYPELCSRLLTWATVSAAVYPRRLLDELPGWEPLKAVSGAAAVVAPPELHVWATCLASALTHRGRLSADDVRAFTLLYEDVMPRLPGLINEPVPARS